MAENVIEPSSCPTKVKLRCGFAALASGSKCTPKLSFRKEAEVVRPTGLDALRAGVSARRFRAVQLASLTQRQKYGSIISPKFQIWGCSLSVATRSPPPYGQKSRRGCLKEILCECLPASQVLKLLRRSVYWARSSVPFLTLLEPMSLNTLSYVNVSLIAT